MRRRMWLELLLALLGVWLALCALVHVFQERLIFFPGGPPLHTPRDVGLEYEEQWIARGGDGPTPERLHAWWIPAPAAGVTVLVHHGNAGSIEQRLELARVLHGLRANVLLYDYAGYGQSDGSPSVARVRADLERVWQRTSELSANVPIVVWGESLGGALAAETVTRLGGAGLVLESAFSSLSKVASEAYRFLPVRALLREDLDTLALVERVQVPVLVLHGRQDSIIGVAHGRALHAAAPGAKELVEYDGGHNDKRWYYDPRTLARLRAFVDGVTR